MARHPTLPTLWNERLAHDPFADMRRAMASVFGDPVDQWPEAGPLADFAPAIDVSETDDALRIALEVPGVDEKDIHVSVSGDRLIVRGEKRSEAKDDKDEQGRVYHRVERTFGRFQRSMSLPFNVDANTVTAEFDKGVLTVTLPKPKDAVGRPRRIEVQSKS